MRAERYYQTSNNGRTITLTLLSTTQCEDSLTKLGVFERNCLIGQGFKGCFGDMALVNDSEGSLSKIYVGAGDDRNDVLALASVANRLPRGCYSSEKALSHDALVTWSLAQYRFDKYKRDDSPLRVLLIDAQALIEVLAEADAVFLVRDLINTPANDLGPQELATVVASIAEQHGAEFKQWVGEELLSNNFPAIYTVGRGAEAAPRLLSLVWGKEHHPRVTLVGKGVCFDSGGLDIKPAAGMRLMKKDMGGAAHVIGLAQWLMTHQVPIRLHVLIPAVENAIDGQSYRPGDVLKMRNGLTVEVDNTDAEGRLVLADALVKACEEKPELLINFATLTGAARVAVGTEITAMFSNDDQLADALIDSAKKVSDPIWRMPLFAAYEELFRSTIADFANGSDTGYAGAIIAALFLQRFVKPGVPWVHFDMMAWNLRSKPGKPEGGEAMGMRAVGQFLRDKYKSVG